MITKEELKQIPEEELKLYYNEYQRRYKIKNKDRVNAYRREHYKRNTNNTNVGNTNNDKKGMLVIPTINTKQNVSNTKQVESIF